MVLVLLREICTNSTVVIILFFFFYLIFLLFHKSFHIGEVPVADEFDYVGSDWVVVDTKINTFKICY